MHCTGIPKTENKRAELQPPPYCFLSPYLQIPCKKFNILFIAFKSVNSLDTLLTRSLDRPVEHQLFNVDTGEH